jgi:hypothetical protein
MAVGRVHRGETRASVVTVVLVTTAAVFVVGRERWSTLVAGEPAGERRLAVARR